MSKKNNLIALRIDDNLKEKLEELAFNSGNKTNVSDYIRNILKENIDLIEKQQENINKYGFEAAMQEIYINTNYRYFNKIRTNNEKITYSNHFINLLIDEIKNENKTLDNLLSIALIKYNIYNCSKYSSDENQKIYKLLKVLCEKTNVEEIFKLENYKEVKTINEDEIIDIKSKLSEKILHGELSDIFIDKIVYLKKQYVKYKSKLYELKEILLSKQFDWNYYKDNYIEHLHNEIIEYINKVNALENVIFDVINDVYSTSDYNEWKTKYFSKNTISSYDRLELKQLLNEKSHWELESELDFSDLITNIEFDIIIPINNDIYDNDLLDFV